FLVVGKGATLPAGRPFTNCTYYPKPRNNQLNPTSTALLVLCFSATLAQNNQLRFGGLAGRYA
ncbi:hypothetical protein, partial [Microbulbifer thermotolerans]|uniref:hypothetical protein n=1 Tax=Microbulbifer thermotolerans TaxID=252514 RepID=UPI002248D2AD